MTQNMFMQDVQSVIDEAPILYKFFRFNENVLYALIDSYLWFSVADKFNDPFEGVSFPTLENQFLDISKHIDCLTEEEYQSLKAEYCKSPNSIRSIYLDKFLKAYSADMEQFRNLGFCCFLSGLEKNELTVDQEMMMWSHYSDGLRGFRFIYDTSKLIKSIPSADIYPIVYKDTPPTVSLASYMYETRAGPSSPRYSHSFGQNVFTTKHRSWSYEREIRLRRSEYGACPYDKNSILGVDFGSKMTLPQIRIIQALLAHLPRKPEYRIAHISDSSYRIMYSAFAED
ncbi:DUF2971 domain-containing protein [Pseudomonas sp. CBC3]|uniref:DUF2971 domain-containing protein n=1 Tax=Pseudomonas sp. CBC3 TaxID=3123318 RepID=UPI0030E787AF